MMATKSQSSIEQILIKKKQNKDSGDFKNTNLVTSSFNVVSISPTEGSIDSQYSFFDSTGPLSERSIDHLARTNCTKIKSKTSSKVLEMFDKISPRNRLTKELSALQGKFRYNSLFREEAKCTQDNSVSLSDSDSEILNDDQFEHMELTRILKNDSNEVDAQLIQNSSGKW